MSKAVERYGIAPEQLTLHQDRGSPMTAVAFLETLADYPGRFTDFAHTRAWCADYFEWYNTQHHHSGLAGFTPEQVFTDRHKDVARDKQVALDAIYEQHPERFVAGKPTVTMPPEVVAINPVPPELHGTEEDRVIFPTLQTVAQRI